MSGSRLLIAFLIAVTLSAGVYPYTAVLTPPAMGQEADGSPPVIQQLGDQTFAAFDGSGLVVSYLLPAVSDDTDPAPSLSCSPSPGTLFPLGATIVTCESTDESGNRSAMSFVITIADQSAPVLTQPSNVEVTALDAQGVVLDFALPTAFDNVDGPVPVQCNFPPGTLFPIGETWVTCSAWDGAGNLASVSFGVTVLPPPVPVPTATSIPTTGPSIEPTETQVPATVEPSQTEPADTATGTPRPSATPTDQSASPSPTPTAAALVLGAPVPAFVLSTGGGPLGLLSSIWGGQQAAISQEFGYTAFSVTHTSWYWYGRTYGLDGLQHPGIDIALPAGTPLYSPVSGTVKIAGGQPFYTFYGNGLPGVGELLIQTDSGDQVILGHMGLITVQVGDRVTIGQFVGLSGGYNGDHLHLETRSLQHGTWYLVVDPRKSFVVRELESAAAEQAKKKRVPDREIPRFPSTGG